MYKVKVLQRFKDASTPDLKIRNSGDIIDLDTTERLLYLMGDNPQKRKMVELISASPDTDWHKKGPKIIIYQSYLYHIGGIETFLYNFVKHYKDRNITVIVDQSEIEPLTFLSQYCVVEVKQIGQRYKADVCILGNYNCQDFLNRCDAKRYYQMIHADWRGIMLNPAWANFSWSKPQKIDQIICVSQTAADGLKEVAHCDSEVIYNILDDDITSEDDLKVFITLSRATAEKGIYRIVEMAKRFKAAGKRFVWFLGCTLQQAPADVQQAIKNMPEFIVLPPVPANRQLIGHCDYLVQLSDTESFCYSAFEALQRGVPVILTRFTEASNIVEEGKNGYLVEMDLSDLDIDKIFSHKPQKVGYVDRCDYDKWEKVFKGEL